MGANPYESRYRRLLYRIIGRIDSWRLKGRLRFGTGDLLAANKYGRYCVPRSAADRPAARAVLLSRVWEPATVEFLRAIDSAADIIHAGTFFGDFLPGLASSRAPGARVWAFEPNPESYRCASETIHLNDLRQVTLVNAGLHHAPGSGALAVTRSGHDLGGGSYLTEPNEETVNVLLISIDQAVPAERHVGVIHLDVEGHELDALNGAIYTIRHSRPLLVLESVTPSAVVLLAELGYQQTATIELNAIFSPEPDLT